jgi:hypothetical protein
MIIPYALSQSLRRPSRNALLMCGFIKATEVLFSYSATKFAVRGMTQSAGTWCFLLQGVYSPFEWRFAD